jgi:succinate dehydrogenase / fumarate reductase membrane anchor subunit
MSLRTPLARALNHGAAHDGVGHWWLQRASAVALAPLAIWLLVQLLGLPGADYGSVRQWIGAGWNPVLLSLTVVLACWHAWLGLQVVIEDYVHGFAAKTALLLLVALLQGMLAASGVYAVLRIALRGPV